MGGRPSHALLLQTPRFVDDGGRLPAPDGLACEAEAHIGPAPRRAHVEHLWGGAMTVAADAEVGVGPRLTQRGEEPAPEQRLFCPGGACARAQVRRDQRV
jgi:hypothetical protein